MLCLALLGDSTIEYLNVAGGVWVIEQLIHLWT